MTSDSAKTLSLQRLASRLRQRHAGNTAILVDLSAIPAIHSRIMFRSFARFIEERTIDEPIDALPMARNIVVLMAPHEVAQRILGKLEQLNQQLKEQHHGALNVRAFDLDKHAQRFTDTARRLMEQAPAPASERAIPVRDEAPPSADALTDVITLHRVLWQADLSNQTRRQTIWQLLPNTAPEILADEVWISIAAIERATGFPLNEDIWLLGKATEMLDQRVLSHFLADTGALTRPLSINLHLTSVIGAGFRKLLQDKPDNDVRRLMVEVPLVEWRINAALSQAGLRILNQHGIRLCLDGIQPDLLAGLSDAEIAAAGFLKLDAAGALAQQQADALQKLPAEKRDAIMAKAIFCHCDNIEAVATGIAAGIRYFQGRGVTPLLEDAEEMERLLGYEAAEGAVAALKGLQPPK